MLGSTQQHNLFAKDEIKELEMQQKKMKRMISESKEKIRQMEQGLVCSQMAVSQLIFREELLCANTEKLKAESSELTSKQTLLDEAKSKVLVAFTETAANFCQTYGLGNDSRKARVTQATKQIQELLVKKQELLLDLKTSEEDLSKVNDFMARNVLVHQRTDSISKEMESLARLMEDEESALRVLQEETTRLIQASETDEQFIRVQQEIEACDVEGLESQAEALQAELSELNQQLEHKERKQQRMQYRQWLRQRQQKTTLESLQGNRKEEE
ncbi:dynactin subunit 1 isoform X2 [Aplysia californica]|uniref:Coiled-coil domain-containing protein 172 n=1 Tax=Aplysia californica TaxID=6500 RepID=A0ABM0JAH8_APLCA|nr:dynactin subunit 1 isoform X2 [Aplysia californica]